MGDASYVQSSFLGGEWSKVAQGGIARQEYRTALNVCLNSLPIEGGAWTRRPGFGHAGATRGGNAGRVIQFSFENNNPYTMEFTDSFLRMRAGAALVTTNDDATVASISTANPAVVQTSAAHGWTTGNSVFFAGLAQLCPLLHNRRFTITVVDTTHFSIADELTGTAIDGSTLGWSTPGTLPTVRRVLDIATPYPLGIWGAVRSVQSEKTAVLLHGSVSPQALAVATDPSSSRFATFTLGAASFKDGPYLDPVAHNAQVTPSSLIGNVTLTISFPAYNASASYAIGDYVTFGSVNYRSLTDANVGNQPDTHPANWVAVNASEAVGPNGFVGTDVGRHIRLFSEPPDYAAATIYASGAVVKFNGTYWYNTVANSVGRQPGLDATSWVPSATAARWTWGKIIGFSTLISPALPGAVHVGNLTANGGLAAAYDSNTNKGYGSCAYIANPIGWMGQNYSGASAQKIASVTVWPSNDIGIAHTNLQVIYNLMASNSGASLGGGTLIGTSGTIAGGTAPVSITSTDTTTAYKYVWVEITVPNGTDLGIAVAQIQFFGAGSTGTNNGVTVQILGDPLLYSAPISVWRLGLYSNTTGWPTCGTYHEGRLWLSGCVGNRADGSRSNDIYNFAPTEPDGTVSDSNAIAAVFAAPDTNTVFWMITDHLGIVVGTQAGEWLIQASALNNPLTPTSIQAHRVTTNGCANIEPRRTNLTITFVQRYKRKLMEYFADVFSGRFTSPNLSELAKHLSSRGLEEIAYQQELSPVLWARCTDGSLIGMTYKRESLFSSQGPTFKGWHQHVLGSGRTVESICAGPSTDGLVDTLTMVTNDSNTNVRHVEILTNLWEEGNDITSAWYCDDAIAPSAYTVAAINGVPNLTLFGLWHLNAKTVSVWAGGVDAGDFAVSNGTINIPLPAATLLTETYIGTFSGAMPIVVGFTYNSDGQIVRPATQQETGARNGPGFGKVKRTHHLAAQLVDTQGISFGTRFDTAKMNAAQFQTPGGSVYSRLTLFSDVYWRELSDTPSLDSMICWRVSRPYPATIAAISGFIHTEDQ